MLKETAETLVEDDQAVEDANEIYCSACGHLVTRTDWRIAMDSAHEHTFFNPAGIVFRVLCFKEAPGADAPGELTADFSWFDGHAWRIAICGGCGTHLGWRFEGSSVFFGLAKPKLTMIAHR
ncbi:MAG: cereblon family protein [Rickettsiales bacterium]